MATLHVRNVPDGLYEALRDRAAVNGRSIGAEAVMILGAELGPMAAVVGGRMKQRLGRRRGVDLFDRFTPRAKQVILDAQEAATELGAPALDTDHLLLGLLHPPETVAACLLMDAGLDYATVLGAIELEGVSQGDVEPEHAGMRFTAGTKQALELALRACINQRCVQIEPHHILLGVAQVEGSPGSRILRDAGQTLATLTRALLAPEGMARVPRFEPAEYGFRVLELKGDAAEWEQMLNSFAARGYELVEILDGKAIFTIKMSGP
jgi:plasmid stability protein